MSAFFFFPSDAKESLDIPSSPMGSSRAHQASLVSSTSEAANQVTLTSRSMSTLVLYNACQLLRSVHARVLPQKTIKCTRPRCFHPVKCRKQGRAQGTLSHVFIQANSTVSMICIKREKEISNSVIPCETLGGIKQTAKETDDCGHGSSSCDECYSKKIPAEESGCCGENKKKTEAELCSELACQNSNPPHRTSRGNTGLLRAGLSANKDKALCFD